MIKVQKNLNFDKLHKNSLILKMSSLLTTSQISLVVAHKTLLDNISFDIKASEIIGIVGRNGSGKSSLLKLIAGLNELDEGKMQFRNGIKIGYLAQEFELKEDSSVWEVLSKAFLENQKQNLGIKQTENHFENNTNQQNLKDEDRLKIDAEIQNTLNNLGFTQNQKLIKELSGGEKRKLALAEILIKNPDLLILDEPTNHLDILAIENLEKMLKEYIKTDNRRSVLLVSHDRYFLDKMATRMLEIFDGQIYSHPGNYQAYLENKRIRLEIASVTEYRKQGFLKKELKWVRAGVKARGTKDKGRMDRFEELQSEKKFENEMQMQMLLPKIRPLGNKIINLEEVTLEIGNKKIVNGLNFSFNAKTVLGLVGSNGSGKTSIIKAILGKTEIQEGKIVIGDNTIFNYQDQHKWNLNPEKTIFEEIAASQETIKFGDSLISSRSYLRKLDFDNNQILTQIKNLSGGQRARVILAKILKKGGNCLILDEPTNDLDLETIELLEKSILDFEGVCIIVSHDRYFLNRVCNQILSLNGNGKFVLSTGNYDDYLNKNQSEFRTNVEIKIEDPFKISNKTKRLKAKQIEKLEKQIESLEAEIEKLENEFKDPGLYLKDPKKYERKIQKLSDQKLELEELMKTWEELLK